MTSPTHVDVKALYPNLINLLLDPVFVVDEEGRIVFISEACERLLGYTSSEMVGTLILNYIHPDDLERKRAEEHLRFLAHHDPLTGLTNRFLLYDRLETALRSAVRNHDGLALLYLDLNNFKAINDTRGHEAGDQLLIAMARRLEGCTRDADTVARMGGDEFTVLLTDVRDHTSLDTAVKKIREAMALPFEFDGEAYPISCSIGAALYPEDGKTARQLLSKADAEMYSDKRGT